MFPAVVADYMSIAARCAFGTQGTQLAFRQRRGGRNMDHRANAGRRHFVLGAAGSALALRGSAVRGEEGQLYKVPDDPTKELGIPLPDRGYGTPSRFESAVRERYKTATPYSSWTFTPLQDLYGIVTPAGLHFERSHAGTAIIDPARHHLYIHGMVERPRKYAMDDLERFPSVSRLLFIECSGNTLTEWWKPNLPTVQGTHGLTSTSEWTGVPLATLLREVRLKPGAKWLLAEGADAASMTRSIPIDKAMRDCIVAYGQNGEALRPEQGYPLRLVVPGFEGNMNIKWLRRLEVSDMPFMTREETSKYTDLHPNGRAVQFSFVMEAKSVITSPSGGQKLGAPGFHEITGLAWSGRGAIRRVDVSTDGGRTWRQAALQDPVLPLCHTRFRFPWTWNGGEAILQSRCVDETGYVQPTIRQLIAVRGINGPLGSVYHENGIQSWKVATDGGVSNVHFYN
jgi:sulfane dehydrogenase subunit SoxC